MIEIVTGKTWSAHCKRQTSAGDAVPFETGQTLRAALRETPAGEKLLDVTATITAGTEEFDLSLTDEQTATLPKPRQFVAVRFGWYPCGECEADDTHKVVEATEMMPESYYERRENPTARIYQMGLTVGEVEAMLEGE